MAVDKQQKPRGSHWLVGMNVTMTVVLAAALVIGLQWVGYSYSGRADLTTSGVNSLSEATSKMLADLPTEVRLTSMYFKTDLEEEDQARYRSAVEDLIELYRATNRGKITAESLNPLQDHDKRKEVFKRLATLTKFKEEAAGHREEIDSFQKDLLPRIGELMTSELAQLEAFGALADRDNRLISEVRHLYTRIQGDMERASLEISDALASEVPAYGAAVNGIRQVYSGVSRVLGSVTKAGAQFGASPGELSPAVQAFFVGAHKRYGNLVEDIEARQEALQKLPALEFEDVLRELRAETGNPVLVETADEAKVVSFRAMWPLINRNVPGAGFGNRRFLGEQKLTSAILQLTQKDKPAVVFVRYGGPPLFFGGFMPGQPAALFSEMKAQLEDANFGVHEWDLSTQDDMPKIDPAPSRTIFVVLRPVAPPRGPMGQPPQQPPFTEEKLEALKRAMGEAPRALFLTGFQPGMGSMPAPYEYADYLAKEWGIEATCARLLLFAEPIAPQKYRFMRDPLNMTGCRYSDHPAVSGLAQSRAVFPLVAPISLTEETPEGLLAERIAWLERTEGLWSIQDITHYANQQRNEYILRNPQDYEGDFTIAAAATKAEGKVVVISSTDFAVDRFALAPEWVFGAQGLSIRPRNPGNAAFFVNALHWLNDNTEWVNLGTPIDNATIAIDRSSTAMTFVRALVLGIWPGLAVCSGFVVWLVRRR